MSKSLLTIFMQLITHPALKKHVDTLLSTQQQADESLSPFLNAIDNAFQTFERENAFARRIITLNDSRIFLMLAKENEKREQALRKLINQVNNISNEKQQGEVNPQYVEAISDFIENQIKQNESQILFFLSTKEGEEQNLETTSLNDIQRVGGLNILIVDDYSINIKIVGKLLTRWKVKYSYAENGIEAIEKLKHDTYNLILMDLEMDKMDGFTASEIIRNQYPDLPIIALTSYSEDKYREKAMNVGMNDYITKPVIPSRLLKKMITYCIDSKIRI